MDDTLADFTNFGLGAAAILASTGDYGPDSIKSTLEATGNLVYTGDEERDGEKEPLLDLSSELVFAPVMALSDSPIDLAADGYTVSGWQRTDLSWTCINAALDTDICRDGEYVDSVACGETEYTDEVGVRGAGMHFYRVCQTDVQTICSRVVVVIYRVRTGRVHQDAPRYAGWDRSGVQGPGLLSFAAR